MNSGGMKRPVVHSTKRKREESPPSSVSQSSAPLTWQEALGPAPPFGNTRVSMQYKNYTTTSLLHFNIICIKIN